MVDKVIILSLAVLYGNQENLLQQDECLHDRPLWYGHNVLPGLPDATHHTTHPRAPFHHLDGILKGLQTKWLTSKDSRIEWQNVYQEWKLSSMGKDRLKLTVDDNKLVLNALT